MKSKERDLTGEASTRIKRMVLNYDLRPGQKLEHQALSDRLGMSRTPVREALGRLTEEGFVMRVPHKGYFVAEITEAEARELFNLRELLELYSVENAIKNATPRDLADLRAILGTYKEAISQGVSRRMFLVDENFHLKIAEVGGGSLLKRLLTTIFEKIIMKRTMEGISPLSGLESYRRHLRIFKLIESRDVRGAREQVKNHVETGREAVLQQITQRKRLSSLGISALDELPAAHPLPVVSPPGRMAGKRHGVASSIFYGENGRADKG
jgi:DNA-binding GntR family transcriptional regulator